MNTMRYDTQRYYTQTLPHYATVQTELQREY